MERVSEVAAGRDRVALPPRLERRIVPTMDEVIALEAKIEEKLR
jgi:hypothetical protein